MALSTSQLRAAWSPPCAPARTRTLISLHGTGRVQVDRRIAQAVAALDACLVRWAYRTRREDTGAYVCRPITGGTAHSLHSYGIALDLNWTSNPYGPRLVTDMPPAMVAAICAIRTNSGHQVWRWGGTYANNKDAMHFEVVCTPAQLATGIASASTAPKPTPPTTGDLTMDAAATKAFATLNKRLDGLAGGQGAGLRNQGGGSEDLDELKKMVGSVGEAVNRLIVLVDKRLPK